MEGLKGGGLLRNLSQVQKSLEPSWEMSGDGE